MFQPFSQENPLQTGTGLGLAIVKSIVNSKGVKGELDVSSKEGSGTEMRISFDVKATESSSASTNDEATFPITDAPAISIKLAAFDAKHSGKKLLQDTIFQYLTEWWGFDIVEDFSQAHIIVVDEDVSVLQRLASQNDFSRPIIVLSSARGDASFMSALAAYDRGGGFCRSVVSQTAEMFLDLSTSALFKPGGPSKLRQLLVTCVAMVKMMQLPKRMASNSYPFVPSSIPEETTSANALSDELPSLPRRISDSTKTPVNTRPRLPPRSITYHKAATTWQPPPSFASTSSRSAIAPSDPTSPTLTVSVGTDALLLKSSINSMMSTKTPRILIVEDNHLLRSLL